MLDNVGVRHCGPIKKWLAEHTEQIEVCYLPSYPPELSPDERLNGDLKQTIETHVPCLTKDELRQGATVNRTPIESNPDGIKAIFRDQVVAYAA